MNLRFLSTLLSATVFLSLAACNNSSETSDSNTNGDSAANNASAPAATPTSTINTTPQNMLVVRHKVANYQKWKMAYDGDDSARLANGIHSYVIGRGLQDTNMILVAMKIDDTTRAMAFTKAPALKAIMQKGGVMGTPSVEFITALYQDTATIGSDLRSSAMFTVKSWDEWMSGFDSSKQERADNGLMVRSYGHASNNNNKVRVVTALLDSTKAVAYFKSDMLKNRMQKVGATSVDRFLYRIVQRY
jgi:hypothetical protein